MNMHYFAGNQLLYEICKLPMNHLMISRVLSTYGFRDGQENDKPDRQDVIYSKFSDIWGRKQKLEWVRVTLFPCVKIRNGNWEAD